MSPYADLTEEVFGAIAGGEVRMVVSAVAVAELLVKPFQSPDPETAELCERFLLSFGSAAIAPVDYAVAREAARIRAAHGVRMPDAILLATARLHEATFITNDRALERLRPKAVPLLILDDFVSA